MANLVAGETPYRTTRYLDGIGRGDQCQSGAVPAHANAGRRQDQHYHHRSRRFSQRARSPGHGDLWLAARVTAVTVFWPCGVH